MVEVLVAISVVCVVMLSLTSFFVISTRVDSEQGDRQSAIQAADDAMERARGLQAGALLTGRDLTSSTQQWSAPIAAVANLLDPLAQTMAYDSDAAVGAGATAALPTTFRSVVLNGIVYRQFWYIGLCQRPATGGACVALSPSTPFTRFYRVIVGVTWPGRSCPGSICAYVTSTLIGRQTEEPIFDTNEGSAPPAITSSPGDQTGEVGVPARLSFTSSGGTAPLTWSADPLPGGLSIDPSSGAISGTPGTAGATPGVTVTVTDAYGQKASTSFGWTVDAALSGTPTTAGAYPVTTTVTDARGAAVTKSTTWTVS
jgi:type II secretory pathway pseudopilin PulG